MPSALVAVAAHVAIDCGWTEALIVGAVLSPTDPAAVFSVLGDGRARLGPFWGYLAGSAFVVGKTASCAAMALTVGRYAAPEHERLVAVGAVVALAAVTARGVEKGAALTRVLVAVVLAVLAMVVVAGVGAVTREMLGPL